ncbi:MAG: PD-(D/E)XK motif protein [Thioalkalivibrio sp.]|nr:PD-(D/E)XK motif protein [Thioalkalivibrio sp.]
MSAVSELWDQLDLSRGDTTGYVRLRIREVVACATYAAKRIDDGGEALIIEVDTDSLPADLTYPRSATFSVSPVLITPGRSGRTRLILALADERYSDVFRALCDDLAQRMSVTADPRAAVKLFAAQLHRWQAFLRAAGPTGLSAEVRRGLAGELTFLRDELLDRLGDDAVEAWAGWAAADHDFQLLGGNVEVKTTSANTPHSIPISNVGQLDDASTPALFLCLTLVDESVNSGESLGELVSAVRTRLGPATLPAFDDRLAECGLMIADGNMYPTPKYTVRERCLFCVREGFPRLTLNDLPNGVEDVRYAVSVAACTPFAVDRTATLDAITAPE